MSRQRNAFKAGFFIFACFMLMVAIAIGIKGSAALFDPKDTRHVQFSLQDDIGGLRVGDEVRIGGLRVGEVKEIDVIPSEKGLMIDVAYTIPTRYTLKTDAVLRIQKGLTGSSNLNFETLGAAGDKLAVNTPLRGQLSRLDDFLAMASGAVQHVGEQTLPRIDNATTRAADLMGEVRDVFHDNKGDLRTTFGNLAQTSESAKKAVDSAAATLDSFKSAPDKVNKILDDLQPDLRRIIDKLTQTTDTLSSAMEEIRHAPWRLLYKPSDAEASNLDLFDSARKFADGATALNEASEALRLAVQQKAPDDEILKLKQRLDDSFKRFDEQAEALYKRVK